MTKTRFVIYVLINAVFINMSLFALMAYGASLGSNSYQDHSGDIILQVESILGWIIHLLGLGSSVVLFLKLFNLKTNKHGLALNTFYIYVLWYSVLYPFIPPLFGRLSILLFEGKFGIIGILSLLFFAVPSFINFLVAKPFLKK